MTTADRYVSILPAVAHSAAEDVAILMERAARRLGHARKQEKYRAARRKRAEESAGAKEKPS